MGLGIGVGAALPKGVKSLAKLRELISRELVACVTDPAMDADGEVIESEDSFGFVLCPLAEPLEFVIEDGRAFANAKTSTLGPGYHAALVELLDRLGAACGLAWNWNEDGADETGFAFRRDFAALQASMSELLRMIVVSVHKQSGGRPNGMMLNMPMGAPMPLDAAGLVTGCGMFDNAWFEAVHRGSDLASRASEFYPWWSQVHSPAQWAKLAKAMMWAEVPWHPPCDERERRMFMLAMAWAELAGAELAKAGVTPDDVAELRHLADLEPDECPPLSARGFGYRRGLCRWNLGCGWSINLPGNVYEHVDEEDGSLVLFYSDWAVRLSVMAPEGEPDPSFRPSEVIEQGHAEVEGREVVRERSGGVLRLAKLAEPDDEGQTLLCAAAAKQSFVICTITFANESDLSWAIDTLKTIKNPQG